MFRGREGRGSQQFLKFLGVAGEMLATQVVVMRDGVVFVVEVHPPVEVLLHPPVHCWTDLLDCLCEGQILLQHLLCGQQFLGLAQLHCFPTVGVYIGEAVP